MIKKIICKKAASLLEVLVVLGIISTVMVGSVNVVVKNLAQLKVNELDDQANGVLVQGLEIAKSPNLVFVSGETDLETTATGSVFYQLDKDFLDGEEVNVLTEDNSFNQELTSCSENSNFRVTDEIEGIESNFLVCLQVEISPIDSAESLRYYEITSRVVYELPNEETQFNTVKSFRYETFEYVSE